MSVESLNRFDNDPIVSTIMSTVKEFRGYYNKGSFDKDPWKLMGDKKVADTIQNLEDALYDRFGLRYRLLLNATRASIFFVPTHDFSAVGKDYADYYDALNDWFSDKTIGSDFRNISDNLFKAILESANNIRSTLLSKKPVTLDENTAKIKGLPVDTFIGALNIGFYYFFNIGMTDDEITAIIMHEIGHGFTSISTMNESFTSVLGITEVIKETKNDKKKVVSLVEETYGVKLSESGTAIEYIVANQLFKNAGGYTLTNNEAAADNFVARFGLSVELSTALAKGRGMKIPKSVRTISPPKIAEMTFVIKLLDGADDKIVTKVKPVLALAVSNERTATLEQSVNLYENPDTDEDIEEFEYDAIERRIERLKRDVIRQMRTLDLTKEQKDAMVREVKALDIMVHRFAKEWQLGNMSEVLQALLGNTKSWKHRKFYTMIEDMVENDFHYQKEKYKLLKGK